MATWHTRRLRTRQSRFEFLEPRCLLAAQPVLTEFVASNDSTLKDGFGKDRDWIEIYNAGDQSVDLQGYHLTDKADNPTKWSFPQETILEPNEYLVVFASNDDTIDPAGYWHTNFVLKASGEYLGLANPSGTIISDFGLAGADYPHQATDVSYGLPGPFVETLLSETDDVDYLIPNNGLLGTSWTSVGFNAAAHGFVTDQNGIGYENRPGNSINYTDEINTTVPLGTTSVYIRSEFNLVAASEVIDLSLSLRYDDGFGVYLNGNYLFGENAPGTLAYNSTATVEHADAQAERPVGFSLDNYLHHLQDGANVLAIHALNRSSGSSDMLLTAELVATSGDPAGGVAGYLIEATPGASNSQTMEFGPVIKDVEFVHTGEPNDPITVTAEIEATEDPFDTSSPQLYYRVMFGAEVLVPFTDDGTGSDEDAGDGVYSGQIPASAFEQGEMVRWYITASDTDGTVSRAPRFHDPLDSAEYFGTVLLDPTASDDVEVLYWFLEDEAAAETDAGTRSSLFHRGEFYDNVRVDAHGQSTRGPEFVKKSFDFDANEGEKFDIGDPTGKHSDFNLLTNYADQSKVRNAVAYAAYAEVGGASHLSYPVSVHRNGEFYALYDLVEEGDSEYLRRLGLDPDGALYKVNNNLTSQPHHPDPVYDLVEKKSREYEDNHEDFREVVNANALNGTAARTWYFDHLDIASVINYLATQNALNNTDFGHKNMYWYHDTNHTQQWQILPWDVDLSYGHKWIGSTVPPYFDDRLFTNDTPIAGWNNIIGNMIRNNLDSRLTEMYKRRIRSISDQLYGAAGTAASQSWAYQQLENWGALTADEAIRDMNQWGIHPNFSHTPAQAIDQIQNSFIVARRNTLNSYAGSQSNVENISFSTIEFAPSSGDRREEYITLTNNSQSFATDLSGWTITGAINHTFRAGTVIPAGETLYVVADVQSFQARTTGPRGGQRLFIQGNYTGHLPNGSGSLTLANTGGTIVDTTSYVGSAVNNGDFDNDDDIDGADFLAWQRGFGTLHGANPSDGDADEDGKVDAQDLDLWTANYGSSGSLTTGQAAAVQAAIGQVETNSVATAANNFASLAAWSDLKSRDDSPEQRIYDLAILAVSDHPTQEVVPFALPATSVAMAETSTQQPTSADDDLKLATLVDSAFEDLWT